jgi:hypothetical protein
VRVRYLFLARFSTSCVSAALSETAKRRIITYSGKLLENIVKFSPRSWTKKRGEVVVDLSCRRSLGPRNTCGAIPLLRASRHKMWRLGVP